MAFVCLADSATLLNISRKLRQITKRRRRDSNPRRALTLNGFQDRRLKPLGHSSTFSYKDNLKGVNIDE
jgi:hypothetical protein